MQNKNSSREKIIQSAGQLFLETGYDATSVQDICSHAGVSKGAFYHYFETKQALFMTLMDYWSSSVMQDGGSEVFQTDLSIKEQLIRMPFQFAQAFEAVPKGFLILVDFWRQAMGDPQMWRMAVAPYRYFTDFFVRVVEKGKQDGSIRTDVESEILARLLVAVAMGYLLEAAYEQNSDQSLAVTSEGLRLTIEGIGGK